MRRLLNPFWLRSAVRQIRSVASLGGPRGLRLVCVGEPRGVVIPTADVVFDVIAADGSINRFETGLPVPWPYAWTYRLARRLGVPVVRDLPTGRNLYWKVGKRPRKGTRPKTAA